MSEPITPAIERFLKRWEKTRGFGQEWGLVRRDLLRAFIGGDISHGECCPLTAKAGGTADNWEERVPAGMLLSEARAIVNAADNERNLEPEIRRRLLAAVGLSEPKQ